MGFAPPAPAAPLQMVPPGPMATVGLSEAAVQTGARLGFGTASARAQALVRPAPPAAALAKAMPAPCRGASAPTGGVEGGTAPAEAGRGPIHRACPAQLSPRSGLLICPAGANLGGPGVSVSGFFLGQVLGDADDALGQVSDVIEADGLLQPLGDAHLYLHPQAHLTENPAFIALHQEVVHRLAPGLLVAGVEEVESKSMKGLTGTQPSSRTNLVTCMRQ